MYINQTLTKENFWNQKMIEFPLSMKKFCDWIDKYKESINWKYILGETIKYHHLPYAMQQGIWIEFAEFILNDCFEQPEYMYCGDLEDDVYNVFKELEELLMYEQHS